MFSTQALVIAHLLVEVGYFQTLPWIVSYFQWRELWHLYNQPTHRHWQGEHSLVYILSQPEALVPDKYPKYQESPAKVCGLILTLQAVVVKYSQQKFS